MNKTNALCVAAAALLASAGAAPVLAGGCTWDNGVWDGLDGQTSEVGTAVEESRTADDFCLKEGYVYEITGITVFMLTNSEEVDATLQLYHDCDGCPGEPVDCGYFEEFEVVNRTNNAVDGLALVELAFNTGARTVTDEYGEEEDKPALWLKGGCYWASPVGQGDGTGYDRAFWGTAEDDVRGAIPKTQAGAFKINGWEPVDGLNVSCRNFAFRVDANACCIVRDNGDAADDLAGAVDTTGVGSFNADNFMLPSCSDDRDVCFFSAYVWTNCDCTRTKLSFGYDDCGEINTRSRSGESFLADKCVDTGRTMTHNGDELTLYRVEWHAIRGPVLDAGRNHWAVLEVQGSGSFNEKGFWAFADRCGTDCDIHISAGQAICPPELILDFESVGRDYSFCVATRQIPDTAGAGESCVADYNGDGAATITDMLGFLEVWLGGCDD